MVPGASDLLEPETDWEGAIWQLRCSCGRCYTVEVADDPEFRVTAVMARSR